MSPCPFCKVSGEPAAHLHSNDSFFSTYDRFPACPGHTLVVPRRHIPSFFELSAIEWTDLQEAISGAVKALEEADLRAAYQAMAEDPIGEKSERFCRAVLAHPNLDDRPDGYNIGINEGRAAGRTIDHMHVHILPRFEGDVSDHVGGIRHIITGKGNYTADSKDIRDAQGE